MYDFKNDFPLFKDRDIIYLDNAATAQKPACVIEAEKEFYEKHNANPLRGFYPLSLEATDAYEAARKQFSILSMLHLRQKLYLPEIPQRA